MRREAPPENISLEFGHISAPALLHELDRRYAQLMSIVRQQRNRMFFEDIVRAVAEDRFRLWAVNSPDGHPLATICYTVSVMPRMRVFSIIGLAGDGFVRHSDDIGNSVRELARALGCQQIEAFGRKGWGALFETAKVRNSVHYLEEL